MSFNVNLRDFLLSYAEVLPVVTVFRCSFVESLGHRLVRLKLRHYGTLIFAEKAFELFRVIENEDGTTDIVVKTDILPISSYSACSPT